MGALQPWHIIVLAVVVVALFGYNKLPDVTRSVGRSLRIFKTEMKGLTEDDKAREEHVAAAAAPSAPAATISTDEPTAEQVAAAQAVLAAAAKARADQAPAALAPTTDGPSLDKAVPSVTPSANGRVDTAAH